MSLRRNYASFLFAIISLISLSSVAAVAQEPQQLSNVSIKNFGQMDDRFFRGAQPKEKEYSELAALGIKTVIDLRDDPKDYEKTAVEALGMRYVNIAMSDKDYPAEAKIQEFLKLVDEPSTGKFYVHCAGGRHRTGVVGAVYRFTHDHWNLKQALAEMDQYEFGSGYGHGKQKDFVQDYWRQFQAKQTQTTAVSATANR